MFIEDVAYFCGNSFPWFYSESLQYYGNFLSQVPIVCTQKPAQCESNHYYESGVSFNFAVGNFSTAIQGYGQYGKSNIASLLLHEYLISAFQGTSSQQLPAAQFRLPHSTLTQSEIRRLYTVHYRLQIHLSHSALYLAKCIATMQSLPSRPRLRPAVLWSAKRTPCDPISSVNVIKQLLPIARRLTTPLRSYTSTVKTTSKATSQTETTMK